VSASRVLVTGAGGFLGRHLCHPLSAAGAEVHAVSRDAQPKHGDAHRWWPVNLESEHEARELVRAVKPHTVFHLAGLTHAAPDLALVLPTFRSLLGTTLALLVALAEEGCGRVVIAGSVEEPVVGIGAPAPTSPYGAAKGAATAYARMFHALYATPVAVARLSLVYGPGQAARKVIPATILALLRGQRPRVSSGAVAWDFVYVDDAIDALLALGDRPGLEGATVDVGTGVTHPLSHVVERLTQMIDPSVTPEFSTLLDRPFAGGGAANAAATEARLGWRATTPLEVGLQRTANWYRERAGRGSESGVAA